ncbi:hypothetical protein OAK06_08525 [Gammaproteobacteria bacterium]|nr:hypothetical protein [Gammaproteobacteria bacterium]
MKRLIVVIVLMFLGGCGYSSYEECQLKESFNSISPLGFSKVR